MAMFIQIGNKTVNMDWVIDITRKDYGKDQNGKHRVCVVINLAAGPDEGSDTMINLSGDQAEKFWKWITSKSTQFDI